MNYELLVPRSGSRPTVLEWPDHLCAGSLDLFADSSWRHPGKMHTQVQSIGFGLFDQFTKGRATTSAGSVDAIVWSSPNVLVCPRSCRSSLAGGVQGLSALARPASLDEDLSRRFRLPGRTPPSVMSIDPRLPSPPSRFPLRLGLPSALPRPIRLH